MSDNLPARADTEYPTKRFAGMLTTTCDLVPRMRIVKCLGLVRGSTVRTRHLGHDIMAAFKTLVGGEVENYTKMIAESREQALDRMIEQALELGGNAVVTVRFGTSSVMSGAAELVAYGTAVIVEPE